MAVHHAWRMRSASPPPARPRLSRERAVAMQDALIAAFSDPTFQARLKGTLWEAASDPVRQGRVRAELCLPVNTSVARRFGFESVAESIEAFTAELNADPEVAERRRVLDGLVGVGDEDESQNPYQMKAVMQVFAALPSQHQCYARHKLSAGLPATQPAEEPLMLLPRRARSLEGRRGGSVSKSPAPRLTAAERRNRSASKTRRKPYAVVPALTRESAISMQDALISDLEAPDLQRTLWRALNMAGSDASARCRARHTICVPVQSPTVRSFGFSDVADAMLAFTPELKRDPEIAARMSRLCGLVNPTEYPPDLDAHPGAQAEPWQRVPLGPMLGQLWRVVGGRKMGGIVPRRGVELSSALLGTRTKHTLLGRGAVVQELELRHGERLHYRKISGEGPEFGWVSIWSMRGKQLVKRVVAHYEVLEGRKAYILEEPSVNADTLHTPKPGDIIEVFKRQPPMDDILQLTARQIWELSKLGITQPNAQGFLEINASVRLCETEASAAEESEAELLALPGV